MLCTSSFMDDIMFSHNKSEWARIKDGMHVSPVHQVAAPAAKCAITECIYYIFEVIEIIFWIFYCVYRLFGS